MPASRPALEMQRLFSPCPEDSRVEQRRLLTHEWACSVLNVRLVLFIDTWKHRGGAPNLEKDHVKKKDTQEEIIHELSLKG